MKEGKGRKARRRRPRDQRLAPPPKKKEIGPRTATGAEEGIGWRQGMGGDGKQMERIGEGS
jgi:hypothetical protein